MIPSEINPATLAAIESGSDIVNADLDFDVLKR